MFYRVRQNRVLNAENKTEDKLLAVMLYKPHALMYAEWCAENCDHVSTIFLEEAQKAETAWRVIRVFQPLTLKQWKL